MKYTFHVLGIVYYTIALIHLISEYAQKNKNFERSLSPHSRRNLKNSGEAVPLRTSRLALIRMSSFSATHTSIITHSAVFIMAISRLPEKRI